jgi:hypothetical protein
MFEWFCAARLTLALVVLDAAGDLCAAGILATRHLLLQGFFQRCFHLQLSPLCGLLTQSSHLDMRSSLQTASLSWWHGRYLVALVTQYVFMQLICSNLTKISVACRAAALLSSCHTAAGNAELAAAFRPHTVACEGCECAHPSDER